MRIKKSTLRNTKIADVTFYIASGVVRRKKIKIIITTMKVIGKEKIHILRYETKYNDGLYLLSSKKVLILFQGNISRYFL